MSISALFGAAGLTGGTILGASVVDQALGLLKPHLDDVQRNLAAYGDVPTNHDLERGIRLAQLVAAQALLRDHRRVEEAERSRAAPEPPAFEAMAKRLRTLLGQCPSLAVVSNDALVGMLEGMLDGALAARPDAQPPGLRAEAERAAWEELTGGLDHAPDESLRLRFFGEDARPGWFALFVVFFREMLRTDRRVESAFLTGRVAGLVMQSRRIADAVGDLHGEVRAGFAAAEDAAERRHREQMAAQRALMEAIAREKGVPTPPLLAVLRRLGEAEVAPEDIPARLEAAADRLRELEERLARPSNDRPETQAARAKARALIDAGELDAAEAVLRDARAALRELREQTAREEAALLTDEAGVAEARLAFREAAELHREAARLLDFDDEAAWAAWRRAGVALAAFGRDFGDPAMLRQAVDWLTEEVLPRAPRATRPLDWATTQNWLGIALKTLGERGDDTALREAVTAYRASLDEYTRERVPLGWAMAKNNLGNALATQGMRGDDTALREAVIAYRAALGEYTRERVPLDWAMTQNNLGIALATLGTHGDDAALHEAVLAYRESLKERTRDRLPLDWAITQNNLGMALGTLGERGDNAALHDAVAAYRAALEEVTRQRTPLEWAMTQHNLGVSLSILGARGDDMALCEAVAAFRAALEERTRERLPFQWARTTQSLALALHAQAERCRDAGLIADALAAIDGAIEEYAERNAPRFLDGACGDRERILATARALGAI